MFYDTAIDNWYKREFHLWVYIKDNFLHFCQKKKCSRMPTVAVFIKGKLWKQTNMSTITKDGYLTYDLDI